MLQKYKQQSLAVNLLNRKVRATIVHQVTEVSIKLLRKAYKELHGRSSSQGSLKFSIKGLTRNNQKYIEVTHFAVCFRNVENNSQDIHAEKVILAFDTYKQSNPSGQLDFGAAWVIARGLADKSVQLTKCPHCKSWVLLNARENRRERCGVCKTLLDNF
ncbi:FlhC family transcriptional regulator [Methylomonas sp. AM2-LC]|uniref:FlhC family transcriptional regulator n=1 Tax=Methylomonas sp. AM2-LC TaxID=3153301 RepID=UPI003262D005